MSNDFAKCPCGTDDMLSVEIQRCDAPRQLRGDLYLVYCKWCGRGVPFVSVRYHEAVTPEAMTAWNAALSPAELGGVELDEAERRSRDQRAMGWDAICNLLFELRPGWVNGAGTGIELAVAAIREGLSTPRAAEADWLPIESAPKDAPYWLVWSAYYQRPVVVTQRRDDNTYWEGDWDFDVQATHWTAALTPPSAKGE